MHFIIALPVLILSSLVHAAMEPFMNNLTVNFFTVNGNTGPGIPAKGNKESILAARVGTSDRLRGTYALLFFDIDRCSGPEALCTMTTNLTSASGATLLGAILSHQLIPSTARDGATVELPPEIDAGDGTMRLLFNTTDKAAPAAASELLGEPWISQKVVAGSEDTQKRRSCKGRGKKRKCKTRPVSGGKNSSKTRPVSGGKNSTSIGNLLDEVRKSAGGVVERGGWGWLIGAATIAVLIVE
ncbi:hypothetical protein BU23DRAFT_596860 [Bimuria novae-zelandiae CBS 107.79]|uniref:Uncharacterized protein n=1 Tax=Bimuria novae-zelandiae CBS 107.79 TaxID=1447943 RepID=A0A6A5VKF4_9PLEO|nr:hypothetical protein BU23DRAFT_596860 [Bimuria novae-zelandiae CBS 107.79]